jgi:hypothetical protein
MIPGIYQPPPRNESINDAQAYGKDLWILPFVESPNSFREGKPPGMKTEAFLLPVIIHSRASPPSRTVPTRK